jgi:tRNA dimethylallyltransferase
MQVYRGIDILSSKPGREELNTIRHHLIDIVPASSEFNVLEYRSAAIEAVRQVLERGKQPVFVGGTGHYMTILLDGIFEAGTEDPEVRARLFSEARTQAPGALHFRLEKVDPAAAAKIHPNDTKRIVRALEVFETTGRPISELQKMRTSLRDSYDIRVFCLNMPREQLYDRINRRVDAMFGAGAVDEVKRLAGGHLSRTSAMAIGIKEIGAYLRGEMSLDEAKDLMKRNTRNYARRQLTWFRKDKLITWVNVEASDTPQAVANRIAQAFH